MLKIYRLNMYQTLPIIILLLNSKQTYRSYTTRVCPMIVNVLVFIIIVTLHVKVWFLNRRLSLTSTPIDYQ